MGKHRATRMSRGQRRRGSTALDARLVIATVERSGAIDGDSDGRHRADAACGSLRAAATRDQTVRSDTGLPAITNAVSPDRIPQLIARYTGGHRAERQPWLETR
jgi:hypothetical protein